ncbi:hypothetical protein B0H19DRAFT_1250973 [Mycena capillaripes]|nr:hypothetical protein B0H19DRAFT_1250973 [Mycena capillaripes]
MAETPKNQPQTLPTDLERVIFETAAHARPQSIPKLMLVAWRVKLWLEQLLYQTMMVGLASNLDVPIGHPIFPTNLLHLIQPTPTRVPGDFVRHLFLVANIDDARAILSACCRIENLWLSTLESETLLEALR